MSLFQVRSFFRFYRSAWTKYQLHSPFVYDLACAALEDPRRYYAFTDIEILRQKMLESGAKVQILDFGTGARKNGASAYARSVRSVVRHAASSPAQGQMLFRLVQHFQPETLLELGGSLGISTLYLSAAAGNARVISLEGSPELARIARVNLEYLRQKHTEIKEGPFEQTLRPALESLGVLDFVYVDGNHRAEPTLEYFETCLAFAHDKTVFVFDDIHWSAEMELAWAQLRAHPRVRLTVDFYELSLVFIDPAFREVQHFQIVPQRWKPWRLT